MIFACFFKQTIKTNICHTSYIGHIFLGEYYEEFPESTIFEFLLPVPAGNKERL